MTAADDALPTLRDLACELGQVQIQWSFLEGEMRRQLAASNEQKQVLRGPIISHWRAYAQCQREEQCAEHLGEVERIARLRNLLAHGIELASADHRKNATALVVCVDADGTAHTLTIDDIREMAEEIDRVRRSIRSVRSQQNPKRRSHKPRSAPPFLARP